MKYKMRDDNRQKIEYVSEDAFATLEFQNEYFSLVAVGLGNHERKADFTNVDLLVDWLGQFEEKFPIYVWNLAEFGSLVHLSAISLPRDEAIWCGFPIRDFQKVCMFHSLEEVKKSYGTFKGAVLETCALWGYKPLYLPHSASRIILSSMDIQFPKLNTKEIVPFLKVAKGGGLVTINHNYTFEQLSNVHHVDICSAYSAAIYLEKFPVNRFTENKTLVSLFNADLSAIRKVAALNKTAYLIQADFHIDNFKAHKARLENFRTSNERYENEKELNFFIDENRTDWVGTEYDVLFLMDRFGKDLHFRIKRVWSSKKDLLPIEVRNAVKDFFLKKQQLKKGTPEQKQVKLFGNLIAGNFQRDPSQASSYTNLPPMQWGLWLTSMVRYKILKAQMKLGAAGNIVLYGDTDSIFWLGDAEVDLNEDLVKSDELCGGGKYCGLFYEEEGNEFIMFKKKMYKLGDAIHFSGGCEEGSLDLDDLDIGIVRFRIVRNVYSDGKGMRHFRKPVEIEKEKI